MMLTAKKMTESSEDLEKVMSLYARAFPRNERRPLEPLIQDEEGGSGIIAFYDETLFIGFLCFIKDQDITHIIYFAVEEALRGHGYGSEVLAMMQRMYPGDRLIVDIEAEGPETFNHEQRLRRKQFYLRNGYTESEVKYTWRQESYEILVSGGTLSKQEFHTFWKNVTDRDRRMGRY